MIEVNGKPKILTFSSFICTVTVHTVEIHTDFVQFASINIALRKK